MATFPMVQTTKDATFMLIGAASAQVNDTTSRMKSARAEMMVQARKAEAMLRRVSYLSHNAALLDSYCLLSFFFKSRKVRHAQSRTATEM